MRRMPWSISPSFSHGAVMYSLLSFQVLSGEGRSFDTVLLTMAHSPTTSATPTSERTKFSNVFFMEVSSRLQIVYSEAGRVLLRVLRIEDARGKFGGRQVRCRDLHAEHFHRGHVQIGT